MQPNQRYLIAVLVVASALILGLGVVRACTGDQEVTARRVDLIEAPASLTTSPVSVAPTTEAPAPVVTEAPSRTGQEPEPTVPPSERPQSFTAGDDDSAAWACLRMLESTDGKGSRNLYGIMAKGAGDLLPDDQLAWARRIRDDHGSYLVGWPSTGVECGLP